MNAVLKRHSSKSLDQLLNYCALIDKNLKSSQKYQVWDQFNILLLAISGINMTNFQKV